MRACHTDPAFPFDDKWPGMDKYELVAAMALQGILATQTFMPRDMPIAVERAFEAADEYFRQINGGQS